MAGHPIVIATVTAATATSTGTSQVNIGPHNSCLFMLDVTSATGGLLVVIQSFLDLSNWVDAAAFVAVAVAPNRQYAHIGRPLSTAVTSTTYIAVLTGGQASGVNAISPIVRIRYDITTGPFTFRVIALPSP